MEEIRPTQEEREVAIKNFSEVLGRLETCEDIQQDIYAVLSIFEADTIQYVLAKLISYHQDQIEE